MTYMLHYKYFPHFTTHTCIVEYMSCLDLLDNIGLHYYIQSCKYM